MTAGITARLVAVHRDAESSALHRGSTASLSLDPAARDHLAVGADRDGPAGAVGEAGLGVDSELVVEGHQQVLRRDRPVLGNLALGVRRADDPPARNPPPATSTLMTLPQ